MRKRYPQPKYEKEYREAIKKEVKEYQFIRIFV